MAARAGTGMAAADQDRADQAAQAALWNLSKHPLAVVLVTGLAGWLVWLTLAVSDLKTGQVRMETGISARLDQLAADTAENRALLLELLERRATD